MWYLLCFAAASYEIRNTSIIINGIIIIITIIITIILSAAASPSASITIITLRWSSFSS